MVFQNDKSRSFRVRRRVPQGSVLGPVLFSLFINDLLAFLPCSVSFFLYADDLAIWSSSLSVPAAVEATQGVSIRLERCSEFWCFSLNPRKCEVSFFLVYRPPSSPPAQPLLFQLPPPFQSHSNVSWGDLRPHFLFLNVYLRRRPSFFSSQGLELFLCFLIGPLQEVPLSSL